MAFITIDFETFYDVEYSLSKVTTEEYVRDPRFEVIGVGVKVDDGETEWASGSHEELSLYLSQFDWADSMVLAHNMMFDGAILSWQFGIVPKAYADTLCMARALHGVEVGGSLKKLAERYQLGVKGTEVVKALGKRREQFTPEDLAKYGDYCINDVELTYDLFKEFMAQGFPKQELRLIDLTLRMFTTPTLELDKPALEAHLEECRASKEKLLEECGVIKSDLMSNKKLALVLGNLGVTPPMKISKTTGKETYAFSKTDEAFLALQDHHDPHVQTVVAARLGAKSTLEETRTQRFIDIASRGKMPGPIRYCAAHTTRWGGDDKINLQNLPSRGPNAKKLKKCIVAPEGHVLIDCDSSQIEARVVAWLAEQEDVVEAFAAKKDVYKKMASQIYSVAEDKVTSGQREVGKAVILGCGYGMGAARLKDHLALKGVDVSSDEARHIIQVYREANWCISNLWASAGHTLKYMANGDTLPFGREGVLEVYGGMKAIRLPSGLCIRYGGLRGVQGEKGVEYMYDTRKGPSRIYGGKVVENVCQGIARCIIGEQMLKIAKRYRVVLTVHDSVVACVAEQEAEEAQAYVEQCMRYVPSWATGLPVNCESEVHKTYGG